MNAEHSGWKPVIFLYGPPGVGKSRIGQFLAQALAMPFDDLDEKIEQDAGAAIPHIFAQEGEAGFRQRESRALEGLVDGRARVIALGGGTLISDFNRRLAEANGQVVLLTAALEVLQDHLSQSAVERPLLGSDKAAQLPELLKKRQAHYHSFSHQLDVSGLSVEQAGWQIQVQLGCFHIGGMQSGARSQGYPVRVIPGGLDDTGRLLDELGLHGEAVIVTDNSVGSLYAGRLKHHLDQSGRRTRIFIVAAGEGTKSLETANDLWEQLAEIGLDRSGLIIALGGGMITDLAGFAASLYLRGIRWVAVPTSLLGMVDASLGGKTGVNLAHGKNLVGSFYPPALVLSDPEVLGTLPQEEFRSGMAEVVKHGVIADPELFAICSQGQDAVQQRIHEIVCRAMAVKVRVVIEDPYESGEREALNLGHTLGHALEKASGYSLRHGEAVAVGMAAAARFAARLGYLDGKTAQRVCETLEELGLPTHAPPEISRQEIERLMHVDKKRKAGRLRFVLPVSLGRVKYGIEVDDLEPMWEAL